MQLHGLFTHVNGVVLKIPPPPFAHDCEAKVERGGVCSNSLMHMPSPLPRKFGTPMQFLQILASYLGRISGTPCLRTSCNPPLGVFDKRLLSISYLRPGTETHQSLSLATSRGYHQSARRRSKWKRKIEMGVPYILKLLERGDENRFFGFGKTFPRNVTCEVDNRATTCYCGEELQLR